MSGPVPSPSMKGMIGRSGTFSLPLADRDGLAVGGRGDVFERGHRKAPGWLLSFHAPGGEGLNCETMDCNCGVNRERV